ncbi:hypothetical protein AQUCO_02600024v1 [Aquilegia coerulea]|uniref:Uncharacterized protein n=1 Tax=Aquilegia coerulea TaxID=218851 RepID=A0A2G5D7V8_AQUCA|nr:hypothetical protein AQUCO_02600024v1 [Aquilegia coerulea]
MRQKDGEEVQRGQADVPAGEMLSDDYYEQDGEEQSDSLHDKKTNRPAASSLKHLSRPVSFKHNISRKSKSANGDDDCYKDKDEDAVHGIFLNFVVVFSLPNDFHLFEH